MKILIFGAHPDDPETGCGGLIANATAAGHDVHCVYATIWRKGQEYFGRPEGDVRSEEAIAACTVLGATYEFLEYEQHKLAVDAASRKHFIELTRSHAPDIVLTHWPVDTHDDHRPVAALALEAFLTLQSFDFYYYEVLTGQQSLRFMPTHYVDISDIVEVKREAVMCHICQNPPGMWSEHEVMHHFRGLECGVERAEAFVQVNRGACVGLPGMV